MDYQKIAGDILDHVGGKENIKGMTHCFTRLRFVLKDSSKADKAVVERLEGVISVVIAGGQFQVVCGNKVTRIYDAAVELLGGEIGAEGVSVEIPEEKQSLLNVVLQKISEIFTPLVPAIAAAGLIKGLLAAAGKIPGFDTANSTYVIMNTASNIIFYFMPIFLAYTAAKALRCSQVIAMLLGGLLCHPTIDALMQDAATKSTIFGLPVVKMAFTVGESTKVFAYTESVIPIILGVIVLYYLERFLKKYIPDMLQLIMVPGISLIVMVPVMLVVVGPVGIYVGYVVQWLYGALYGFSPILGGIIVGGLWGVFVIFGAHRALLPIGLNDVAMTGTNTLMCFAGSANFAQAGAALGVMFKTKSAELKQVAASSSLSAWLVGVTEPAIYGCNLRLKKPMVCAVIAGAAGGAVMGIGNAVNTGFANNGVLTIMSYWGEGVSFSRFLSYLIGIAVAFFGAAVLTYIVGFEDDAPKAAASAGSTGNTAASEKQTGNSAASAGKSGSPAASERTAGMPAKRGENAENAGSTEPALAGDVLIGSPVEGTIIPMSEIDDQVFASGVLGKGVGILPAKGEVVAPADCTVALIYESKHAIGLKLAEDVELLIHVGINTVELAGKYFESFVENGQQVKKGTRLVAFDVEKIRQAGYDTTVCALVSNGGDYSGVNVVTGGDADVERTVIAVEK